MMWMCVGGVGGWGRWGAGSDDVDVFRWRVVGGEGGVQVVMMWMCVGGVGG